MADITYCTAVDCNNKKCYRHLNRLTSKRVKEKSFVSLADFAGTCRYYIAEVLREIEEERNG